MMNSEQLGKIASDVEETNISTHGIWLLVDEREFFLSYEDFPWFKEVPIGMGDVCGNQTGVGYPEAGGPGGKGTIFD